MNTPTHVLAIDPGREKSGIAVLDSTTKVLLRAVVPSSNLAAKVQELMSQFTSAVTIMGNGTGHKPLANELTEKLGISVVLVDESYTSEQARDRWRKENPARGLRRFLPDSMRSPTVPYDDTVAVILGERYLAKAIDIG